MTTLVATRQALHLVPSMSDQQKRRTSKRLAGRSSDVVPKRPLAAAEYEQDDDFQFVRKSKRPKTEEPEPARKPGRGRSAAKDRPAAKEPATSTETPRAAAATTATTASRRSSRRKASADAPPPQQQQKEEEEEPQPQPPRRATRKSKRLSGDADAEQAPQTNGAPRTQGRGRGRASPGTEGEGEEDAPQPPAPVESAKIALPMSDTPVINRNKEMRKKGASNRRSSLGSRGRRASSLIENGQTAIPHREVDAAEFYKHIEAEGLPEPRRMKQLLMWCGERALSEKPAHGTPDSNVILGARAIQEQLLKDFASRSELSDWFSRDDDDETQPKAALQPNPRNVELDEKLASLEANIKRLEEEQRAWLAMQEDPPELPPLFAPDEAEQITLPDFDLLDADEGKIRGELADEANSSAALASRTEARLRRIQSSLEFEVDQLADNVHKLEQRVAVAGKEADRVLEASAARLREREQRDKARAGTQDLAIMEVLRSLGSIRSEGNGG